MKRSNKSAKTRFYAMGQRAASYWPDHYGLVCVYFGVVDLWNKPCRVDPDLQLAFYDGFHRNK